MSCRKKYVHEQKNSPSAFTDFSDRARHLLFNITARANHSRLSASLLVLNHGIQRITIRTLVDQCPEQTAFLLQENFRGIELDQPAGVEHKLYDTLVSDNNRGAREPQREDHLRFCRNP